MRVLRCAALWITVFGVSGLTATTPRAEPTRVQVTIENLAPAAGTFQTPVWIGFHDGGFDTYDPGTPASSLPLPGSLAMERLCEDGDTAPLSGDFAALSTGVDATLFGPGGPLAPGDIAEASFVLDSENPDHHYFSYASMVIPSNDFCVANGTPKSHAVFDSSGAFAARDFFVTGAEVLDAGTEVNDELPETTAFLAQMHPDTGTDESGAIDLAATGFAQPGSGGVLDVARFRAGDFAAPGYPVLRIGFAAAPAIEEDLDFAAVLNGRAEVPAADTRAFGFGSYRLRDGGQTLSYRNWQLGLEDIVAAHLHLAPEGANGPVVAFLLAPDLSEAEASQARRLFSGQIGSADLVGPLSGQPLDALVAEIAAGNVYVNVHTTRFGGGEIRGQLVPR